MDLFQTCVKKQWNRDLYLGGYISAKAFMRRVWLQPGDEGGAGAKACWETVGLADEGEWDVRGGGEGGSR